VKAGKPLEENDYRKTEIEGISFYIRNDMADQAFEIQWYGVWVFGQFVVKDIKNVNATA
jgi:hypothetical protein